MAVKALYGGIKDSRGLTMASVMCLPMAPVPPNIRIVNGNGAMLVIVGQSSNRDDLSGARNLVCACAGWRGKWSRGERCLSLYTR